MSQGSVVGRKTEDHAYPEEGTKGEFKWGGVEKVYKPPPPIKLQIPVKPVSLTIKGRGNMDIKIEEFATHHNIVELRGVVGGFPGGGEK